MPIPKGRYKRIVTKITPKQHKRLLIGIRPDGKSELIEVK